MCMKLVSGRRAAVYCICYIANANFNIACHSNFILHYVTLTRSEKGQSEYKKCARKVHCMQT